MTGVEESATLSTTSPSTRMDILIGLVILCVLVPALLWLSKKGNDIANAEYRGDYTTGQSWLQKIRALFK